MSCLQTSDSGTQNIKTKVDSGQEPLVLVLLLPALIFIAKCC